MTNKDELIETMAHTLHIWYLEATSELRPESYNPNAQKPYDDMTDEQKAIDRYIAKKVVDLILIQQRLVIAGDHSLRNLLKENS